ncbi:MAG: helix-turn-helix transcriptional regulator [Hespellia sp.]|nr:helix-turn-helix transcriptional regulator [Hespellia sp.]
MAKISDRIKMLRTSAGMTQEEFGKQFGIVKSTVSLYESGKSCPNDEIKVQICNYFKVPLDFLIGISNVASFTSNGFDQGMLSDGKCRSAFLDLCDIRKKTTDEVVSNTGIDKDVIENWFIKEIPTLEQIVLVADCLSTSVDYLLGRTDNFKRITDDNYELVSYYNRLSRMDQRWIFGMMTDLIKKAEENDDEPVAAGEPVRKVSGK